MNIHVFTHFYNEARMLPFWMRHYATFADRLTVFVDRDTTDASRQIAEAAGAEVRLMPLAGLQDDAFVAFAADQVRACAADWALWPDCDEFILGDVRRVLADALPFGWPLLRPFHGWQMIHPEFPADDGRQLYQIVTRGTSEQGVTKPVIVRPGAAFTWAAGKHQSTPAAQWTRALTMLHFRRLGLEYHLARNAQNWARLDARNRALGHGFQTAPEHAEAERGVFARALAEAQAVPL